MATATNPVVTQYSPTTVQPPKLTSIKKLAESSSQISFIPSAYKYNSGNPQDEAVLLDDDEEAKIPIVDFSLLTSGTSEQRSKAISDLGKACEDWGFFMVYIYSILLIISCSIYLHIGKYAGCS